MVSLRLPALIGLIALLGLSGCTRGLIGLGGTAYEIRSEARSTVLSPDLPTRVYRSADAETADIYLTDLPDAALAAGDPAAMTGNIIHIHLFVRPKAGRTPIDPTAFNASIEHLVVAQGRIALYQGGGFLIPAGSPGDRSLGGKLEGATLRLERATPGLKDLLGPSRAHARFDATRNEQAAAQIDRVLRRLARLADAIDN